MVGDRWNPDVREGRFMSMKARGARACVFLVSLVLMLSLFVGMAQAAPETIAEFGEGPGRVDFPRGAAIDRASGDLYIADGNNFRISKFDADGNFLLAWGFGVADGDTGELQTCGPEATPPTAWCLVGALSSAAGAVAPRGVTVDQASGDVYVVDNLNLRVSKFTSSGEFLFTVGRNVNETKAALGGGATQAEKNICTAASGDTCGGGESGTEPAEFDNSITTAAVDSAGVVWVGTTERLTSFDASGTPGAEVALPGAGRTQSLALDSADNFYVISELTPCVRKLEAGTGAELETLDCPPGQPRTVTLDEDDNVYVGDDTDPYRFKVYNAAGEQTAQFGAGEVIGAPGAGNALGGNALAVDTDADKLYAASSASPASAVQAFPLPEPGPVIEKQGVEDDEIEPTTATLTATINPENDETEYRFEYGTTDSYGESTPIQTLSASFDPNDVEAGIAELIPDTIYHFRAVATNHCNDAVPAEVCTAMGEDQTFRTLPAVLIDPQWVTDVTAHSATLHAELDPLGVEAEAWLEYGTSDSYGQIIPLANLGDGFGPVKRQVSLAGLQSATTYHFRFAARDERDGKVYTVHGPDRTFTTQFGGIGFELADGRVWEMVSPPNKRGAKLVGGGEITIQASVDGDGLAYQSRLSIEENPEGNRSPETSMALARREADGSWATRDITPFNDRAAGIAVGVGTEYKLFSSDLSQALLEPRSGTPLSPEASERTPYLRENTMPSAYEPLVTGKEPFANVPPGIEFGGEGAVGGIIVAGASPDFRHVAVRSDVPLVEGAGTSAQTAYLWSDGQLEPVSVLPASEGGELVFAQYIGSGPGSIRGAVSEDGSRVFWSTGPFEFTSGLYVRDTVADESVRLDVPDGGLGGPIRPVFQGASADGTVVFFTDKRRLTEDAGFKGFDLYRCELPPGSVASGCATLTNISVPLQAGENAEMQGIAPGMAGDGETIYFVARGVLDDLPNELGDSAVSGEPNLYLWQQGQGVRFIATLAENDRTTWGVRDAFSTSALGSQLAASISPNGRYLAFMSERSLTGYDNRDATSGVAAQEVFRYDALADQLECVSCNPAGTRPQSADSPKKHSLVNPLGLFPTLRTAAMIPLPLSHSLASGAVSLYAPRAVLDNGRVFYNAIDSLVPADSNGQWDVYQYEPTGVGDCLASSGSSSIARLAGGCVSLLSSGTAEEEAAFLDASETGDDVFFWTPARLSVLDEDNETDIYDARVDGVAATLPLSTECLGEACQPPPQAPNDPTPASAAFQGPGNVRPAARKKCPKSKRRVQRQGRVRCVPRKMQQKSRKGQQEQRKAGGDRRVTR